MTHSKPADSLRPASQLEQDPTNDMKLWETRETPDGKYVVKGIEVDTETGKTRETLKICLNPGRNGHRNFFEGFFEGPELPNIPGKQLQKFLENLQSGEN